MNDAEPKYVDPPEGDLTAGAVAEFTVGMGTQARLGVRNGDFSEPPPDPSLPIDNSSNPLPGYLFVQSVGTGTLAAWWVADATTGSSGVVELRATAAAVNDAAYLEQAPSTVGSAAQVATFIPNFWFKESFLALGKFTYSLDAQYLDASGAITGAAGVSAATGVPALPNTTGLVPVNASTMRLRLGVVVTVANSLTLGAFHQVLESQVQSPFVDIRELDPPGTPSPGSGRFYVKAIDSTPHFINDGGTDTDLSAGGGGGAPTTADYLVGTAQGGLSAEIVVGATPGGELGGPWSAPTVDPIHSGSAHADFQPLDADLTAIAALTTTAYGRAFLALANAAAARTAVGTVIGTDVQAFDADLAAIAALASAADKMPYATGSGTWALTDFTAAARALLDDTTAVAMLATLGAVPLAGGTMSGLLLLSADPAAALGAATKQYVDTVAQGLDAKASAACATTANITLSGEQTIDGIVTSASRVLVKNQTTGAQNGIYLSAAGAWSRVTDMDAWAEVPGAFVFVEDGTVAADTGWVCLANPGGTLGSTSITWTQFSGAGTYTAGTGLSLTGSQFALSDVELLAIAGLTSAADRLPYFTGPGTAALATFAAAARSLLALTAAADRLPYFDSSTTAALATLTAAGRALIDDADAAAQRTTLGLGALATLAQSGLDFAEGADLAAVGTAAAPGSNTEIPFADHVHAHEPGHVAHDTIYAAKGDTIAATANDAAQVVSVGANATTYSADSAATPGVSWLYRGWYALHFTGSVTAASQTVNLIIPGAALMPTGRHVWPFGNWIVEGISLKLETNRSAGTINAYATAGGVQVATPTAVINTAAANASATGDSAAQTGNIGAQVVTSAGWTPITNESVEVTLWLRRDS